MILPFHSLNQQFDSVLFLLQPKLQLAPTTKRPAQTVGKSRPDCSKPAQPARYPRQYFGNVYKIESNCAQHLSSASNIWRVSFTSFDMQPAISEFALKTNK